MERSRTESMIGQEQAIAQHAGGLVFARGKVGEKTRLASDEAAAYHAEQLGLHTRSLTKSFTADCGDERFTLKLADGTSGPTALRERIVPQLFGGIGLATTKALVAANAVIVKDAKNIWEAYEATVNTLAGLKDEDSKEYYEDAGHMGCGASNSVEASVANEIPAEIVIPTVSLFMPQYEDVNEIVAHNRQVKNARLQDGFYGGWAPQKHIDFLTTKYPQNFSYLKEDPNDHETHGHHGSSVYFVTERGKGFAKNSFIEDTGQEAFSVTLHKIFELAEKLGHGPVERQRIAVAFLDDTLHVGAGIVAKDFPVFVQPS